MNLDWNIETKKGCFQGTALDQVIKNMIEFYAVNDCCPQTITEIYACENGEVVQQIPQSEIDVIENRIKSTMGFEL